LPIGRKKGVKYALLVHDLFQLTEANYHRSRYKAVLYRCIDWMSLAWSFRVADAIWCPSQYTARQVALHFPRSRHKTFVLPNHVIIPEKIGGKPAYLPDAYWLVVGTREPRKNIPFFLDVWLR